MLDHEYAGQASRQMATKSSLSAPPPPQLLAQINETVQRVEKVLREAGADASMLSDRIFGPMPTAGNTREDRVEHSGFAESILDRLSDLHGLAETVAERTRFLNSRL